MYITPRVIYGFKIKGSDLIKYGKEGYRWITWLDEYRSDGDWADQDIVEWIYLYLAGMDNTEQQEESWSIEQNLYKDFIRDMVSTLYDFEEGESFEDSTFIIGEAIEQDECTMEYIESLWEKASEEYFGLMGHDPNKAPSFHIRSRFF